MSYAFSLEELVVTSAGDHFSLMGFSSFVFFSTSELHREAFCHFIGCQ